MFSGNDVTAHTHILEEADALVLVVVQLLLLPPVLVFGGLETHGDQLRAGQHLAAFGRLLWL